MVANPVVDIQYPFEGNILKVDILMVQFLCYAGLFSHQDNHLSQTRRGGPTKSNGSMKTERRNCGMVI